MGVKEHQIRNLHPKEHKIKATYFFKQFPQFPILVTFSTEQSY